ncbi:uncharacterized protein [Diadema antillarum]|uniref:uncharacterized protein isoform X1 n=2 Tax=Diadema antillarum TaxID=105358 RepID=UPI003A8A7B4D
MPCGIRLRWPRKLKYKMAVMLWKWDKNNQKIKKIYTDWANHFLEKAGQSNFIADLQVDIANGVLLSQVIDAVTNEKVAGINPSPRTTNHMIENIEKCLGCLNSKGVATDGLLAKDLHQGNLKSVLGLFFSLSRYKQQLQQEEQDRRKKLAAGGGKTVAQQRAQNAKQAQPPPPPRPNGSIKPSPAQLKATGARLATRPQATVNGTHLSVGRPAQGQANGSAPRVISSQGQSLPNGTSRANGNNNNIAGRVAPSTNGSHPPHGRSTQNLATSGHHQPGRAAQARASSGSTVASHQASTRVTQGSHQANGRLPHQVGGSGGHQQSKGRGSRAGDTHPPPAQLTINGTSSSLRGQLTQSRLSPTGQLSLSIVSDSPRSSHEQSSGGQAKLNSQASQRLASGASNSSGHSISVAKQRSLSPNEQVSQRRPSRASLGSSSSAHSSAHPSGRGQHSGNQQSSGRSSHTSSANMPKPQTRSGHGGSSSSSASHSSGVQRRQPPGGSSSQNSALARRKGSSSARSSASDMGSRIPTPNTRGGGGLPKPTGPGQRNAGSTSGSERSRGPSPTPGSYGAISGSKRSAPQSSSQVHHSSSGIPSTSSSNLKPPGSSGGGSSRSAMTRSPSPALAAAAKGANPASSKLEKAKPRSSSAPAQKGIPTPKGAAPHQGGMGKPSGGAGGAGDKAGTKMPPNGKGSMLTKLKIFGKDGKAPPPTTKEKEPEKAKEVASKGKPGGAGKSAIAKPVPPKRDTSASRQAPAKKTMARDPKTLPEMKLEKKTVMKPIEVDTSMDTRIPVERSNSNGLVSPGLTLGSSSPKNALKAVAQKTIGRAFGGAKGRTSPKLDHKEYVQSGMMNGELSDEGSKLPVLESKLKSKLPLHDSDLELNVRGGSRDLDGAKPSGLKAPSSKQSTSKVKPVQTVASQQHNIPGSASQIPSSRSIPKPGGIPKSGLKAPGTYAFRKSEQLPQGSDKEGEEKITYTRGGAYSPVPPKPQPEPLVVPDKEACASESSSKSPLVKTPSGGRNSLTTSPSHNRSPANTATVAPFNYTGSRPPSKDCSETSMSASNDTDSVNSTPIHSQISISSNTSQSSENSVIYQPKVDEEFCTTVYKNDKAVTTFGTPKQQRPMKAIPDVPTTNDYDVTVMNSQVTTRPPLTRPTKETTFGDSITTQLKQPAHEVRRSPESQHPQRSSNLTRRGSLGSASKLTNMSTVAVSIPTDSTIDSSGGVTSRSDQRYGPLLSKVYSNSMRRTFSNRSHLNDLQFTDQNLMDDCNDYVSEDIASGYVSDGDILHRTAGLGDIGSGYMSEGGGTLYARRIGMSFRVRDGMAAVREYLSKSMDLSDEGR